MLILDLKDIIENREKLINQRLSVDDREIEYIREQLSDDNYFKLDKITEINFYLKKINKEIIGNIEISFQIETGCARCGENIKFCIEKIKKNINVVSEIIDEYEKKFSQRELYIFFDGRYLDLRDTVKEIIVLSVPVKKLCRPGCQGLCPECGANLNYKKCLCSMKKEDNSSKNKLGNFFNFDIK